jgi:hypothetical protein
MKRLLLAAVVGGVLAVGLYTASADGGKIGTTLGDESNPMVAYYGPLINAVNHLCPDGQALTTGHLNKDDPLLNLCDFVGASFPGFKLASTGPSTAFTAAVPAPECREADLTGGFD